MSRALLGLSCIACLVSLVGAAGAQAPSVTAEALFRAGRQASARGDHAAACEQYRQSYRIESALGTLLNIAVCEEALGQLASAWEHYQQVLPALSPGDPRIALTRERLADLERRLPRLTLVLDGSDDASTRIELGEIELWPSSLAVPLPLNPGHHELRVLAVGRKPNRYAFEIAEGEQRTLVVGPGPPERASEPSKAVRQHRVTLGVSAPPQVEPSDDGASQRTLGVVALVTGGAGLLTSAVTFGLAIERKLIVDRHCPRGACDAEGEAAARSGRDFLYVSVAGLAVGAVSAATGLYLLWTAPDGSTAARAEPWLAGDAMGAAISGRL